MFTNPLTYHGYHIYQDPSGQDFDEVKNIINTFCYACSRHNDVQFIRFDVRFPDWLPKDLAIPIFNEFISYVIKKYSGKSGQAYYRRAWEQESSDHPHFHVFLLVCDRPELKYTHLLKEIDTLFTYYIEKKAGEGANHMIHFCRVNARTGEKQRNGIFIKQNGHLDEANFDECIRWATYQSKNRGKDNIPKHYKRFAGSQLPYDVR